MFKKIVSLFQALWQVLPSERADDWATIPSGINADARVQNNPWGRETEDLTPETYRQKIWPTGWECRIDRGRAKSNGDEGVAGFPQMILGDKPWDHPQESDATPTPFWPKPVSTLQELTVETQFRCVGQGPYNTVMEYWYVNGNKSWAGAITGEVMVWLQNSGRQPAGTRVETSVKIGNHTYDIYQFRCHHHDWVPNGWDLISLVQEGHPFTEASLDIKAIDRYLRANQYLNETHAQIASVEFGNEVFNGAALRMEVETFELRLK